MRTCKVCGTTDPEAFSPRKRDGALCKKCLSEKSLARYDAKLAAEGKRPRMPFMRGIGCHSPEVVMAAKSFGLTVKQYLEAKDSP